MLDKQELYYKIKEMLIISQFKYWVEPKDGNPTADEVSTRSQRAIDYYLGRPKNPKGNWEDKLAMNRFHNIVNLQIGLIMRETESRNIENWRDVKIGE